MGEFFDRLETRSMEERSAELSRQLPRQIWNAYESSEYFASILGEFDPDGITSVADLADIPVLKKSAVMDLQRRCPPFGGVLAMDARSIRRVYQSPGPIYEPEIRKHNFWRFARALYAAGFRPGAMVHNAFSYHLTPAGLMFDGAAESIGCPVIPGGTASTELQLKAIEQFRPRHYVGTVSYLKTLLQRAEESRKGPLSFDTAVVTGEPCSDETCAQLGAKGVEVFRCYATAEIGLIAYETSAHKGLVVDEGVVVEVVEPGTGRPVPNGKAGEVVVTTLAPEYPLIRVATGDISRKMEPGCPTGRTNERLIGWMGRVDESTKIRGIFVHVEQVKEVVKECRGVGAFRLVVDAGERGDRATLLCEVENESKSIRERLEAAFKKACRVRADVEFCVRGSLPRDGLTIEDRRHDGRRLSG
jgi:phenylacetate-CoA ligase